jgi:hypothetical protein
MTILSYLVFLDKFKSDAEHLKCRCDLISVTAQHVTGMFWQCGSHLHCVMAPAKADTDDYNDSDDDAEDTEVPCVTPLAWQRTDAEMGGASAAFGNRQHRALQDGAIPTSGL